MNCVIYASSTIDEKTYSYAVDDEDKTDQQAQRFNRAVLRGFVENGVDTIAVSYRDVVREIPLYVNDDGIKYNYLSQRNWRFLRLLERFKQAYLTVDHYIKNHSNVVFMADGLNIAVALGGLIAAKNNKIKSYVIVTDVPGIYNKGIMARINMSIIRMFDGFIFLTEAMNSVINKKNKPYMVMEGIYSEATISEVSIENDMSLSDLSKKRVLYAGILDKKYGIENLVEALQYFDDDIDLYLFGAGDCVGRIKEIAKKDKRMHYMGLRDNAIVLSYEKKMDLLINPRSKKELFTQYSFPSKTIEYMSTGVPVLMQELPGMPKEYHHYVYLYEGDKPEHIAKAINNVFHRYDESRIKKGLAAKNFIKNSKNSKSQIGKICKFIVYS